MSAEARFGILISALSLLFTILVILLGFIIRITRKWTQTEDRLDNLIGDVKELIVDKDKTHNEMLATMREDRQATDRRLRWLEETLWRRPAT
jgi:hypothetical protein